MTQMAWTSEAALVKGLRRRETAAFDAIYATYRPRLFAFLLRLSRNRTVAEDLLDETWLRLVASAESLRPGSRANDTRAGREAAMQRDGPGSRGERSTPLWTCPKCGVQLLTKTCRIPADGPRWPIGWRRWTRPAGRCSTASSA
jgi:hypothetical protein